MVRKKLTKQTKGLVFLLILMLLVFTNGKNAFAAEHNVTSFAELQDAVTNANGGDVINVKNNINLDQTLVINDKDITISGTGKISASSALKTDDVKNTMFVIKNSTVKFNGLGENQKLTLDGDLKNRVIYSENSTIELNNAIVTKGSPGSNSNINPGGGIFLRGGSLTATNTDFIDNTPGTNNDPTLKAGDRDLNGGAIYSGSTSTNISISGGSFVDNEVKAFGHGAAIYQEAGILTVDGTSFKNNKGHVEGGNAGTQGACIHTRDEVTATISGVNAEIAKGFNTGGFLRAWKSDVTVTDSTFTIAGLGNGYGYSGGALCFEGGTSKVTGSTFTCNGSKLYHAGGFIDIVGSGTHVIDNNTMTGAGKGNGTEITSFGGAISVEEGANATVTIKDNTITGASASDNGGAIAIGTHKGKSTPSTVTMSGNTISNNGTLIWGGQAGGAVFVGPGATVTMTGDTISSNRAALGGGVYNEGTLTISGGSSLTGGQGGHLGGEIYNNGVLTVDNATITGGLVGYSGDEYTPSHGKNNEYAGVNIYAEKDVTITPNANIQTGKDVRVLDGQSKILLTDALTKEIDVSISETAGGSETQNRKVGYLVAAGKDGYAATYNDANKLHYISKDTTQAIAEFGDHESTGEWDFVLNPKTKDVVLGQRVKLTLHANGFPQTPAKFEGVNARRDDVNGILTKLPSTDIKEDIYDIYAPGEKLAELSPDPIRKGYSFTGWYKESSVSDDKPDKGKEGKTLVEELDLVKGFPSMNTLSLRSNSNFEETNETDITTIINPPEYKLYAGWEKVILVEKVWDDNNDKYGNRPDSVTVKLLSERGQLLASPIELNAQNNWKGEFKNIRPSKVGYTVKEDPVPDGYTSKTEGNYKNGFVVTNSTEFITIEGSKTWDHGENPVDKQPSKVTVTLSDGEKEESKTVGANDNWTWKFENLPKYKNRQEVKYTLTEDPVKNYTSSQDGYNFKNTYTDKFKVHYIFKAKDTDKALPEAINGFKPTDDKEYKDGDSVTAEQPTQTSFEDTTNDGTWTFDGWDKKSDKINKADITFTGYWTFKEKTSDFKIEKKVDKKEFEKAGEELTYTVTVTNTGEKDLTGLIISDDKTTFENPTFNLTLKEKTKTFTYEYTVTDDDINSKKIENTATVKLGEKEKEAKATSKLVEKESDFTVTKTVDKATYEKPGEELTYTVTVKNTGEKKLTGLKITDNLVTLTEDAFDLDVNAEKTFDYKYTVTENDIKTKSILNVATVKDVVNNKEVSAKATSKLRESQPEPKPPITPEYPDYRPLIPFIFGSGDSYTPSEKIILNKDDHKAYMFGYPDWTFRPNNNMTRAEVTTMFARLLKNYPSTDRKYNLPYGDVFESDWYYPAVGFMTENGIIKGYEDGTFRPNSPITRAEFATIASKFEELVGIEGRSFDDVPLDHWALVYINSAYARGWVKGYEDGSFRPDRNITRAEVVTVTNKMLNRYADEDFVITHKYELIDFKDLDQSHWAYFNIMEATHGHDYTRRSNKIDELWHRLNGEAFIFPELSYEDR